MTRPLPILRRLFDRGRWIQNFLTPSLVVGLLICGYFSGAQLARASSPQTPASNPPSAAQLYKLSLVANERYVYSARQFITNWRDDGTVAASVSLIDHFAPSLDKIVYTAPRTRAGVTLIEDGHSRQEWIYLPGRNIVVHSTTTAAPKPDPATELALMTRNYSFNIGPQPVTVGGRKAYLVTVLHHGASHPFERLWIDPFTGVILRQEKFTADGTLTSVTYLDDIDFHTSLTPSDFTPAKWVARKTRTVQKFSRPELPVNPQNLPPPFGGKVKVVSDLDGYSLMSATLLQRSNGDTLHLLYTDGLNALSLYASPRHTNRPTRMTGSREVRLSPGEPARVLQRYSYWLLNFDTPGMTYTLAGDVNLSGIMQVARIQYQASVPAPAANHTKPAR